jgi:predicted enzyme related to lactoylglutathione lyase
MRLNHVTLPATDVEAAVPSGASVHFEVDDVDEAIADLRDAGFKIETEPTNQPYLWREATLLDPGGNRIFIYHAGEMRLNPPWRLKD